MNPSLSKRYNPDQVEERWYQVWEARGYFKSPGGTEPFSIVIPPPNITGSLHMGHALNNTLQDIVIRYRQMDGFKAIWFPGTDHAGIATQNVVERELDEEGLTRHDLGREAFVKRVWAWKEQYGGVIRDQLKALGCSCDWDRERFTLDDGLSRAVVEVFVRLYEEGYIYRDDYIINWCPRCMTALSDIEVDHLEHDGKLYTIRYPLVGTPGVKSEDSDEDEDGNAGGEPTHVSIATTRPETMLGDTGIAVHPEDDRYRELIGRHASLPLVGRELEIVGDEAVDPEFGTGVLKVTPAHDMTDFEIGRRHGFEPLTVMNLDGTMNDNAGKCRRLDRYACREKLVKDLEAAGYLERVEEYQHAIGHCQRCGTMVEPLISRQWFVEMAELAQPAIDVVRDGKIELIPDSWNKVYFDWMENIRDWVISRQLWWGHRIPAWYCDDCDEITVSREVPEGCSGCESHRIHQDEDVLDTWFSSALWPFTIMGWPEETEDLKEFYPTSLLITGHDILFFWVARMIMMGLHFMEEIPFREVLLTPLIKDETGQKMSKSKGNVIDPLEMKANYGMDALRFTLAASTSKGRGIRLSTHDIDGNRKFLNKIWNVSRFVLMNLGDSDGDSAPEPGPEELRLEDRWIRSRLQRTIVAVRRALKQYDFNHAAAALYGFVWSDFCDWYVEMTKPRLYGYEDVDDASGRGRETAQAILYTTLVAILKLVHPFMPFITEEIWGQLPAVEEREESIMIAPFPQEELGQVDPDVEARMETLQSVISSVRTIRSEMNVPPNAEVEVLIKVEDAGVKELVLENQVFFHELANARITELGPAVERPTKAPRKVLEGAEVFIPLEGLIDMDQERERLQRELASVKSDLDRSLKRLNNAEFLEKAPDEVIEKEKGKREEFLEKKERLEKNLEALGSG
ncbi:MAG: valine--tRNA ligase [Candidatus Bipolaricaulia bacterium]